MVSKIPLRKRIFKDQWLCPVKITSFYTLHNCQGSQEVTQVTFTCLKSTIQTLEKDVK